MPLPCWQQASIADDVEHPAQIEKTEFAADTSHRPVQRSRFAPVGKIQISPDQVDAGKITKRHAGSNPRIAVNQEYLAGLVILHVVEADETGPIQGFDQLTVKLLTHRMIDGFTVGTGSANARNCAQGFEHDAADSPALAGETDAGYHAAGDEWLDQGQVC